MKNKLIKICVCIATVMLSLVLLSTSLLMPDKINAASRLFGIQNIVDMLSDTGKKYKMLEIVPDKAYSSLGFLSANSEISFGKNFFLYKNNAEERSSFATNALKPLETNGYITMNGGYEERLYKLSNDTFKSVRVSKDGSYSEIRKGHFTESLDIPYAVPTYEITPLYSINITVNNENPTADGSVDFLVEITASKNNCLKDNKIFTVIARDFSGEINCESTDELTYEEKSVTVKSDKKTIKFKISYNFVPDDLSKTLEFKISDGNYESNVISINMPETAEEPLTITETDARLTNYDEDYLPSDSENASFIWVDNEEESEHTVYFNELYYSLDFKPTGEFAKNVFEFDLTNPEELKIAENIIVETKTPDELDYLVATDYDLIYISKSTACSFSDDAFATFDDYSATNNISWETAAGIFEAATNSGLPVIIDRAILNDLSDFDKNLKVVENNAPSTGKHPAEVPNVKYDVPQNMNNLAEKLASGNNILRLAYLFRYYIATNDSFLTSYDDSFWTNVYAESVIDCGLPDINKGFIGDSEITVNPVFEYGKFGAINGNVFINGLYENGKNVNIVRSGLKTNICNYWEGYTTMHELECRMYGLTEIANEIINDNFYNNSLGTITTSEFSHDGKYDKVSVNGYSFLKYIVNYHNRRLMLYKDKIRVLDIEPTRYSTLTEEKVKKWFGTTGDASKIYEYEIVQMSTYEFIGKIEDLVENYDLIYIGSCPGPYGKLGSLTQHNANHEVKAYSGYSNDSVDEDYENLIYSHIGHFTTVNRAAFRGLKAYDYVGDSFSNPIKKDVKDYLSRYSGNDISKTKYNDLTEFVLAGYPVILSSKFFTNGNLNSKYIDPYSYLYKFINLTMNGGTYTYSNFNLDGEVVTRTETITSCNNVIIEQSGTIPSLVKYANMPRLSISLLEKPTEYAITEGNDGKITNVTYLEKVNGKSYLTYTFEISNTAEIRPATSYYKVRIYTDTNADGKFNGLEELDDLSVVVTDTGEPVETNRLRSGIRYTVTRELADNYIGLIPWKLVVELYEDKEFSAKTSEKGYTAIKAQACTIKVLQIAGPSAYNLKLSSNDKFKSLFGNVKDKLGYDIQITDTTNRNIVTTYKNGGYGSGKAFFENYLDQFDMLIIGFQDTYEDIDSDEVMEGIQHFIKAGKSILFSHDTTSFNNAPENAEGNNPWGYHMNIFLRALVGMDRFGITTSDTLKNLISGVDSRDSRFQTIVNDAAANSYDVPYMPDGTITAYCEGFNNYELSINKADDLSFVDADGYNFSDDNKRPDKVTQLNDGQITTFPYNLNISGADSRKKFDAQYLVETHNTLSIADTHAQYYQLNMDMDKDGDGVSDLVVWYCLSGEAFDAVPNDAMNGYYIYTVGNVTYTGMGHFRQQNQATGLTLQETKLFINTILASYRAGIKAPSVGITADTENKNNTLTYLYRTNEAAEGTSFEADEKIGIFAKDINVVQAFKKIKYLLYYEITEEEYNAGKLTSDKDYYEIAVIDGETVYLKAYSLSPDDIDYYGKYFEFDSESPGYISETDIAAGVMENDRILGVTLKADWLNEMTEEADANNTLAKLYFGAWSVLTYTDRSDAVKETTKSFTKLTIRNRDFFDLD